ncbi:hypothetical protein METBIDRAFT_35276, partial [Metschnikowia bicuspidata var. bicuspidata NRRL YB-4993]
KKIAAPQFRIWSPTTLLSVALCSLTNVDRTGNSASCMVWPQPTFVIEETSDSVNVKLLGSCITFYCASFVDLNSNTLQIVEMLAALHLKGTYLGTV